MPRLLDLFCGAGGAAMGYSRVGFEVAGVDIKPQPRYPFEFHQADALEYLATHGQEYDAIHASPPCQYYTRLRYLPWLRDRKYWRSIPPTREGLRAVGKPWVIENVADAKWDMPESICLCGSMMGLPIFRHRLFESWPGLLLQMPHQKHQYVIAPAGTAILSKRHHGFGTTTVNDWNGVAGHQAGVAAHKKNMGIDWMNGAELSQAIPPAYTEFIGKTLMRHLEPPNAPARP